MTRLSLAPLLELATAYQRSRVLAVVLELEIPTRLATGSRSAAQLASDLDAHPLAIGRLLDAAVALGLLVRSGDCFADTPIAAAHLVKGRGDYLGDALLHSARASQAWSELGPRIRAWRPGPGTHRPSTEAAPVGAEIDGQHRLALLAGEALAEAVDLSAHRRLLDLGGGTGAMSIALCSRFEQLRAVIVERAGVAKEARVRVGAAGLRERIEVTSGDFVREPLPRGADAVLLANVLSMLDAGEVRALFARAYDALPTDGLVVITGWMLDEHATGPLLATLLSLADIALDAPDVERPWPIYAGWLAGAGFERIQGDTLDPPLSWLVARKP